MDAKVKRVIGRGRLPSAEEMRKIVERVDAKMEKLYPTTMINGKRVPVCKKCGLVTDTSPLMDRTCRNPYCSKSPKQHADFMFDI